MPKDKAKDKEKKASEKRKKAGRKVLGSGAAGRAADKLLDAQRRRRKMLEGL